MNPSIVPHREDLVARRPRNQRRYSRDIHVATAASAVPVRTKLDRHHPNRRKPEFAIRSAEAAEMKSKKKPQTQGTRNFPKAETTFSPPYEISPGNRRLRPMLLVTIEDFAFRDQPVIRLISRRRTALFVELVGTTPDFLFQTERNHAGPRVGLHHPWPGLRLSVLAACSFRRQGRTGRSGGRGFGFV